MTKRALLFLLTLLLCGCITYTHTGNEPDRAVVEKSRSMGKGESRDRGKGKPRAPAHIKLLEYTGFEVLYNSQQKIPVYVRYVLTKEKTDGPYARKGKEFRPDENLSLPQADGEDYRRSGWSRGHMAPAADFKWSDRALWDTFYYTNCCPQNAGLNNGKWNQLEQKVRNWTHQYGKIRVTTGPIVGKNKYGTLGAHQVVIPDAFYKALLVSTPSGPEAIAFILYNQEQNASLAQCALSVDRLEQILGYDLFPELDNKVEKAVEAAFDLSVWGL